VIYFVIDKVNKAVKIGYTKWGAEERISSLQSGNPNELILIGVMSGDVNKETEIHQKFNHLRIRREWFYFTDEVASFLLENSVYTKLAKFQEELSVQDIQDIFGFDEPFLKYLVTVNQIPHHKISRNYDSVRFSKNKLMEWLQSRRGSIGRKALEKHHEESSIRT